ncbi:MAG: type II toxin-antitoxin system VapC family toxin [Thermoplasmatota archaeon]
MSEDYPSIFVDTSAWIALNEKRDSHHNSARSFVEKNKKNEYNFGSLHTSEMVLQKTYTFLRYNYNYDAAVEIVDRILDSNVIIHPFRSIDFKDIWKRVKNKENKLSFVDWTSVQYMDNYGIKHIFSFDGDFNKLGYTMMP